MDIQEAYTYDMLAEDIRSFRILHRNVPVFGIGNSRNGRELTALKLGRGSFRVFYNGAHHGMEWLTAKVLFRFASELAGGAYSAHALLDGVSLYIVPMVNPDGVEIAAGGKFWQANAAGVDLNHNYNALWQLSKKLSGVSAPAPTRYCGEYPESEPETRAIADFTRLNRFDMVMALHSQGEVIYYDFCGTVPVGTEGYLDRFEAVSRYVRALPDGISAYGGYKDWFIKSFKKPGFTIEIGSGKNPLPLSSLDSVYEGVLPILIEGIRHRGQDI